MREVCMRLLVVRHGEARTWASRDEVDGLTERGREQARLLRGALANAGVTRVVASPTPRAVQTAELAGWDFEVEPAFEKFNYGDGEVQERRDGEGPLWLPEQRMAPSGESLAEFHARVAEGLGRLRAGSASGVVVLVAHGGVIQVALREAMGLGAETPWLADVSLGNASITEIEWAAAEGERPALATIVRVGDVSYLPRELVRG